MRFHRLSCAALCALLAGPALAVDGVREINNVCATTTGCFAGDTAGFPVTITQAGSYRLTSNLTLASASDEGITVTGPDVSIDLNGFAITGITICSGTPTSCSNPGTGRGIASSGALVRNLSVRNGTVAQMGGSGIYVGEGGQVQDVRVFSNGGYGIETGTRPQILRCKVERNGQGGILAGVDALVADNSVAFAGGALAGIEASGGIVRGNLVVWGAAGGIDASGALIADNVVRDNAGASITAGIQSTVSGNTIESRPGGGPGIDAADGTRIFGNTITMQAFSGFAITTGSNSGYADNLIRSSNAAPWINGGFDLGGNLCNGATLCP
jgi:hypothetical protein